MPLTINGEAIDDSLLDAEFSQIKAHFEQQANVSCCERDDGKEYKIFGESGVEKTAKEFNKEFLGHLPIHQDLRRSADEGDPLTHSNPDHEVSKLFLDIADKIKTSLN